MIGDGLSHVGFGAFAVALALNQQPIVVALPIVVIAAYVLLRIGESKKLKGDAAIAVISSGALAVGYLVGNLSNGFSADIASYMFGSIITVTTQDITILGIFTLLCVLGVLLWWRPVMYLAFDRDFSSSQGLASRTASYILTVIVAITIVLAIRIMGIVLLLSLFTIPAVTANTLSKSYAKITILAAIIGVIGAIGGLIMSYNWEIPPGTCIIFILTIMLIAAKLLSLRSKKEKNAN